MQIHTSNGNHLRHIYSYLHIEEAQYIKSIPYYETFPSSLEKFYKTM